MDDFERNSEGSCYSCTQIPVSPNVRAWRLGDAEEGDGCHVEQRTHQVTLSEAMSVTINGDVER